MTGCTPGDGWQFLVEARSSQLESDVNISVFGPNSDH